MKYLFFSFLTLATFAGLTACDPYRPPEAVGNTPTAIKAADTAQAPAVPLGKVTKPVGEKAPFEIKGDTVFVNNRICAFSGTWMREDTLGNFLSYVKYDGSDPRFKGKTLVFNQCCGGCIGAFPKKWANERDKIMRFHGLT